MTLERLYSQRVFIVEKYEDELFWIFENNKGLMNSIEWKKLKELLDKFYEIYSDDDIETYNKEVAEMTRQNFLKKMTENNEIKSPKVPGYVYFIESNGLIKIGRAKNVKARLKQMKTASPFKLKLLCVINSDDCIKLENDFHKEFESKRKNGEWFQISKEDIQKIRALQTEKFKE